LLNDEEIILLSQNGKVAAYALEEVWDLPSWNELLGLDEL
jgi:hypothetical protein